MSLDKDRREIYEMTIRSIVEIVTPLIEDAIADESVGASITFSAVSDVLFVVFLFLFCVTVLPSIVGGIALMKNKKWGLVLCAVSGILSLPSFPFGTGVGVFTIFVLIKNAQAS